jgi:hypothetical protein
MIYRHSPQASPPSHRRPVKPHDPVTMPAAAAAMDEGPAARIEAPAGIPYSHPRMQISAQNRRTVARLPRAAPLAAALASRVAAPMVGARHAMVTVLRRRPVRCERKASR